jgi:hypothetical protein
MVFMDIDAKNSGQGNAGISIELHMSSVKDFMILY